MRRALVLLAAIVVFAAGLLYGCDRLENPQREFASVREEVFAGGWVPRILPASATDIRTQHNIDSNRVWVRFVRGSGEFNPEKLGFRRLRHEEWPATAVGPRYASWWFESLEKFRGNKAALYGGSCSSSERAGYLLVAADVVYLWCEG